MARDRVVGRPADSERTPCGVRSIHPAIRIGNRLAAIKKENDMARPQMGYAPKAGKARKSGPEKMRMSHIRLRKDIKRIEAEQAKAAAAEVPKTRRK